MKKDFESHPSPLLIPKLWKLKNSVGSQGFRPIFLCKRALARIKKVCFFSVMRLYPVFSLRFCGGICCFVCMCKKKEKGRLCERFGKTSLSKTEQQAFRFMDQKLIAWVYSEPKVPLRRMN